MIGFHKDQPEMSTGKMREFIARIAHSFI
jgi:hypothetical protein